MKKNYIVKAIKDPKNALYVIRVNTDLYLGKKIFKNDAGLKFNLDGKISLLKTKKIIKDTERSTQAIELEEKGYVSLGNPFEGKIENIISKYKQIIEDDKHSVIRTEYKNKVYSRMIFQVYKEIPEINNFLTDKIKNLLKEYYKGNFQVHHVLAWRNYHVPEEILKEKKLLSSAWHCDGRDTSRLSLMINLSNVTENDGPYHMQSKQRTKELIKMGFGSRYNYKLSKEVFENPNYIVKNIGPAGTLILGNPQLCFHRAGVPNLGKIRDVIEFRFKPSNEPLPDNWIEKIDERNLVKWKVILYDAALPSYLKTEILFSL